MVLILKDNWCGCSLQTNTKIIGSINLLANLINATLSILQLARLNVYGIVILFKCPLKQYVLAEVLAGVFDTVASSCMTVCSILLIYAAYSNGHIRLVLLYLVTNALVMLTNAAFLIRCVFVTTNGGVVYVVEMFFSLVFGVYLWWVVYSYYLELKTKEAMLASSSTTNTNTTDTKGRRQLLSQQQASSSEV